MKFFWNLSRSIAKALSISVTTAALLLVLYYVFSYVSTSIPNDLIAAAISEGFAEGELRHESWYFSDSPLARRLGPDQYTDCLALHIALNNDFVDWTSVVSQKTLAYYRQPCADLEKAIVDRTGAASAEQWPYDRYMQGTGILLRYLLPVLSIGDLRWILRGGFVLVLFAGMLFHCVGYGKSSVRHLSSGHLSCLIVLGCFAVFYGLDFFSASPTHAFPSAVAVVGFVALSILFKDLQSESLGIFACSVFGALTAWFEFLNGGAPLGLVIVLGTYGIWLQDRTIRGTGSSAVAPALLCALSYCTSFVFSIGMKAFVSYLSVGSERDYFERLEFRLGDSDHDPARIFAALYDGIEYISYGIHYLGIMVCGASAVYGIFGFSLIFLSNARMKRWNGVFLISASIAMVLIWYSVFRQHTIIHYWFMVRLSVWPIAMLFLIGNYGLGGILMSRRANDVGFGVGR